MRFSLQLHQEVAFSKQRFLVIFKVSVLFSKILEKTLKEQTAKLLNQWIGKHRNTKHFYVLYRVNVLREIRKDPRKMPMFVVCFNNITIWLSEPDSTTNVFWNMFPPFFVRAISQNILSNCMSIICDCLANQISNIVAELCKNNCRNFFREILWLLPEHW